MESLAFPADHQGGFPLQPGPRGGLTRSIGAPNPVAVFLEPAQGSGEVGHFDEIHPFNGTRGGSAQAVGPGTRRAAPGNDNRIGGELIGTPENRAEVPGIGDAVQNDHQAYRRGITQKSLELRCPLVYAP